MGRHCWLGCAGGLGCVAACGEKPLAQFIPGAAFLGRFGIGQTDSKKQRLTLSDGHVESV